MKALGPREERETIITFNDLEPFAQIWTASDVIDRRLRKSGLTLTEEGDRHSVFTCPKIAIKIRKQKLVKPISEEKRRALVDRMTVARAGLKKI